MEPHDGIEPSTSSKLLMEPLRRRMLGTQGIYYILHYYNHFKVYRRNVNIKPYKI
jgi:hypothetical protein